MLADMPLKLRPFTLGDAGGVASLVGDRAVSKWTSNIPFPYTEQDAIAWISQATTDSLRKPQAVECDGQLVGCVSYWPYPSGGFEVGYWIGKAFWGRGICTAALRQLIGSDKFPAQAAIYAKVMEKNTGSQRVLEKCGFSLLEAAAIVKGGRKIKARIYVRAAVT